MSHILNPCRVKIFNDMRRPSATPSSYAAFKRACNEEPDAAQKYLARIAYANLLAASVMKKPLISPIYDVSNLVGKLPEQSYVYQAAMANPKLFQGVVKSMGVQFATIFSRDLLTATQAKGMSFEGQERTFL